MARWGFILLIFQRRYYVCIASVLRRCGFRGESIYSAREAVGCDTGLIVLGHCGFQAGHKVMEFFALNGDMTANQFRRLGTIACLQGRDDVFMFGHGLF